MSAPRRVRRLASLDEASSVEDGVVVLEGDYGGSMLVVAPAGRVHCSEDVLLRLLVELDELSFPEDNMQGCCLRYLQAPVGTALGAPDLGMVTGGVWLHPGLVQAGLEPEVRAVLASDRSRLAPVDPPVDSASRAAILRAYLARTPGYGLYFGWGWPESWRDVPWPEIQRRMAEEIPPRLDGNRWWPATLRAVVKQAGLPP